ncbi:MAG TPA: CPXCG motif-containing cysteine-rich protein [Chromatiales bacterium]|nr:CPXCG motif-containing cysteine-rich protein [Thiotrichales bacterium]HIP67027.1 CPXCG motif-containing cysteine-rich protein [Chromatiales bacterium]
MTEPLQFQAIICPWCGEDISVEIDLTAGDQEYTEDCQVCCAPIVLSVSLDEDNVQCTAHRE